MINLTLDQVLKLPSIPFKHRELLPSARGLYFVLANTPNPLVYLGVTTQQTFCDRWQYHHRSPELTLLQRLGFQLDIAWLELRCPPDIVKQWEDQLINDLSPALNDTATLTTELKRLENKIAALTEFTVEPLKVMPSDLSIELEARISQHEGLSQTQKYYTPLNLTRNQVIAIISQLQTELNQTQLIERLWQVAKGGSKGWREAYAEFKDLMEEFEV